MQIVDQKTLASAVPLERAMTKAEKLTHWAKLIRNNKEPLRLVSNLERWDVVYLVNPFQVLRYGPTALSLAASNPVFQDQGLASAAGSEIMRFFEISQQELHAFSCNCGGDIDNETQARRIEGFS